jgi:hypothetical protein
MQNKPVKIPYPYKAPEGFFEQFPQKCLYGVQNKPLKNTNTIYNIKRLGGIAASIMILIMAAMLLYFSTQTKEETKGEYSTSIENKIENNGLTIQDDFEEERLTIEEILTEMSEDELTQWTEVYLIDMFYQTPL